MPRTFFEKLWSRHIVRDLGGGRALIHIDRHVVHEGSSVEAFEDLRRARRKVRNPELTWAVMDHNVSTSPDRGSDFSGRKRLQLLSDNCREFGLRLFAMADPKQGISHVIAPEQGIALPGLSLVCGDSHTATCGGIGAWAWGIGTTEVGQVLAGQSLILKKPASLRINFEGTIAPGVYAKDLILHLIGRFGVAAGVGHAVEYAGPAIASLPVEGRMTVCNMSIEFGARAGFVAPDETTLAYVSARPLAPKGAELERALADWRALPTDEGAAFDKEFTIDCDRLGPQVSWGNSPQNVIGVDEPVPDPAKPPPFESKESVSRALSYMDIQAGRPLLGTPIDYAFIGSCTNGRLSDLQAAAQVARGRHVAPGVRALVVPGSTEVQKEAEALGLDRIFTEAGFEWRRAGCSMCVAANGEDVVPAGKRILSTSNRNFENRQGAGSRTHLASPAMVAAAAVSGSIVDVRKLLS